MKHGDYDRMLDRQMEAHFFPKYQPDGVTYGTMEDVGKSVTICDVCEYIADDGRTYADGDDCPKCYAKWEAANDA